MSNQTIALDSRSLLRERIEPGKREPYLDDDCVIFNAPAGIVILANGQEVTADEYRTLLNQSLYDRRL